MIKRRSEAGQSLAIVSLGIAGLLAAAGLAVDMGYLRYEKRLMQTAADSAALAAANDVNPGQPFGASGDYVGDAKAVSKANGFEDTVNHVTVSVTPDGGINPGTAVQVQITKTNIPTFFMQIAGIASSTLSATGYATLGTSPGCIYALQNGMSVIGVNGINAPNCDVLVNGPLTGSGTLNAASVGVYPGPGDDGSGPTTPVSIAQPPRDPLYLSVGQNAPTPSGTCAVDTPQPVYQPGTYCNGLTVSADATFAQGLYIIERMPLQITAGTVIGNGVTFYITTGGSVSFAGTAMIGLAAPTPGDVSGNPSFQNLPAGVLFFQDPGDNSAADISGGTTATVALLGTLYFPGAALTVAGSSTPAANTPIVANSIQVVSGATGSALNADTTSSALPGGSLFQNVSLVQ